VGERIVVGLGNPGSVYARTRHNVGFMVVERLAQRWEIRFAAEHEGLIVGRGPVASVPIRLVQPRQYMNLSGTALQGLPGTWAVQDLIVVYDDIDLATGRLRVRHNGGTGGHRGIASLVATFGPDFDRVRVGVGRPLASQDPAEYVLESLPDDMFQAMSAAVERASDAVECVLTQGLQQAMNRFNVRQSDLADDSIPEAARRSPCGDTRH
jgi:PTH1 family peptidyl-tRNA hydrolase